MPTKKTNTSAKSRKKASKTTDELLNKDNDTLMEFEQFVASKPNNSNKGKAWLAATLVIFIILLSIAWISFSNVETMEKEHKFKAIYLENGQTYYAKIVKEDSLNIYLDEVYYIQMEQQVIPSEEEDAEPQLIEVPVLIKRGQELHRPEGLMQINRSKLVAAEEIGAESEILAEIERINSIQ